MSNGYFLWLVIFGLAALCFFAIAAVVAIRGAADLKDLLRGTAKRAKEH